MADPFASVAKLSAYTKGQISETDPRALDALNGASTAIRRYCGWHISPHQQEPLRLDGPGGRVLSLPTKHLTGLDEITELETLLIDETDYRWSEDGSVKRLQGCWSDEFRVLSLTISHGYAPEDVTDVKQVVLAAVARALSSPTGATREQAGQLSVSWATVAPGVSGGLALLAHELSVLDAYRIEGV